MRMCVYAYARARVCVCVCVRVCVCVCMCTRAQRNLAGAKGAKGGAQHRNACKHDLWSSTRWCRFCLRQRKGCSRPTKNTTEIIVPKQPPYKKHDRNTCAETAALQKTQPKYFCRNRLRLRNKNKTEILVPKQPPSSCLNRRAPGRTCGQKPVRGMT